MEHLREITTKAGEIIDFDTRFVENRHIAGEPMKTGRFERIDYTTEAYEDGITY
ncbi:MAG: hypothetical protein HUJ72_07785, partial [Blautia sp.]|nr:hypothetical protein [Blautia sp.]